MKLALRAGVALLLTSALSTTLVPPVQAEAAPAKAAAVAAAKVATKVKTRKIVTANVNYTRSVKKQRQFVKGLVKVKNKPDVILLQETVDLNLNSKENKNKIGLTGYTVIQKGKSGTTKTASAILVRDQAYTVKKSGLAVGYKTSGAIPYDRYLPWAILNDKKSGKKLAVVSVHMPAPGKANTRNEAAYATMRVNYQNLIRSRPITGKPVITGGDWNWDLGDPNKKQNRPVNLNKTVGLTIQGKGHKPCLTRLTKRLDGFAIRTNKVNKTSITCLDGKSDHRPVQMKFRVEKAKK